MGLKIDNTKNATIDFRAIAEGTDLRSIIEADLGPPNRSRKWLCPFHDDHNPSLGVNREGRRWRCWSCGEHGDAIDWLVKREGLSKVEAAKRLGHLPDDRPGRGKARPKPPASPPSQSRTSAAANPSAPIWQDPAWQCAVDALVCRAEENLWSPAGRPALDWLRARGLADHTITRFRLGWLPAEVMTAPLDILACDDRQPRPIRARRGITIPWLRPGAWYTTSTDPADADPGSRWVGCNVRRLAAGDVFSPLPDGVKKYQALEGSARGFPYPWADVTPGIPVLICEGEFDALIAFQEAGHVVNVLTIGGTTQTPTAQAQAAMAACPDWLLAFDDDPNHAGSKAARRFAEQAPRKARRVWLPHGGDVTEFVQGGGSVLEWLASEWTRFGWPWPLRSGLGSPPQS